MTISVPIHLILAFELQAQEFLQTSDNGESVGQRAAEVRAHDHDQGMDSLAALVVAAEAHTGQASVVTQFLSNLYVDTTLTGCPVNLKRLDADLFEHCLAVLRLVYIAKADGYRHALGAQERWSRLIALWKERGRSDKGATVSDDGRHTGRYCGLRMVPGLRATQIEMTYGPRNERLELHLSAAESDCLARDLVRGHTTAWDLAPLRRPLDAKAGAQRPSWLPL